MLRLIVHAPPSAPRPPRAVRWSGPALALLVAGCRGDLGVALPPPPTPAPPVEASPPPGRTPSEVELFRRLYAGRPDPVAQRARMLAWMSAVDLEEAQLRSLSSLARSVQAAVIADEQAAFDPNVAMALDPVYADIVRAYARGTPSEADLAPLVARLANADRRADARALRYAQVYRALEQAQAWADSLPRAQAEKLSSCRFFLASSLGPLTTPGDYEDWSGVRWRGQDFGAFRTASAPEAREAMDIGGLWAEDGGTSGPASGRKLGVLVLMAAREPGLIEAVEVRLGVRAPDDYRPADGGW